jgi:dipeptidase E
MSLQVVAMGGYEIPGPFGPPSELERYLYEAAGIATPRVCLLATASGDGPQTLARFYEVSAALPCEPCHLALFDDRVVEDLDAFLDECDVVYVTGGNTASMLAVWHAHGLDRALVDRGERGDFVVGGASAGGMCWFDAGFTMSFGPLGPLNDGLGWFAGSFCPHAQQPGRLDAYAASIRNGSLAPGWAVHDGAALHYVDGALSRVVAASEVARVHSVTIDGRREHDCDLI